jgi:ParB family chromosome partitioning protein
MAKASLEAKRGNIFYVEPENLTLVTDKSSPLYDERVDMPLNHGLVENMRKHGWFGVLPVRKNGSEIEVEDGRQRVKAALEANKLRIKDGKEEFLIAVQTRRDDESEALGLMIAANEFRVNDSMLVKARKANRYMKLGHSEAEAGVQFGVSAVAIKQWIRLLDAAPEVQKAIDKGEVNAVDARKLAELTHEEQLKALEEIKKTGGSADEVAVARGAKKKSKRGGASKSDLRKILAAEDAGTLKLTVRERELLGWIVGKIKFSDLDIDGLEAALHPVNVKKSKKSKKAV